MKKFFTLIAVALMAASVNAQTEEVLYFGGPSHWGEPTMKLHDGSSIPVSYEATAQYAAIKLTDKASFTTADYKGMKVEFDNFVPVGADGGVNIIVGVKAPDYNTSYKCDPIQYVGLPTEGNVCEFDFNDDFAGKTIDLLDFQALQSGVKVDLKNVSFVKADGSLEPQNFSNGWGWNKVSTILAYKNPIMIFAGQWHSQTVATDEQGTLVSFDLKDTEKQTFTVEFEEPTTGKLNWAFTLDTDNAAGYEAIEPGSTSGTIVIDKDKVAEAIKNANLPEGTKASEVTSVFLQNSNETGQTVKVKSVKRVISNVTDGISNVENLQVAKDSKMFNLAGQQVGKDYKGIVIKDGKKVVVK